MSNKIILETKLVGDVKGEFFVPSYQRGYRWGKDEVIRLLEDIYQNGKKNYCLQPVVVRNNEGYYELIDGQQRLTTLYLIYRYMKNANPFFGEPAFGLYYETRKESADFLKNIDISKREDNIDFWFMANAYDIIKTWFEKDLQIRVLHIFEYLKENVKIIWYEVGHDEDAIGLFTRLNIGKIALTSAELVKAMFLSRDTDTSVDLRKQEEIAFQWDNMEKELHHEPLWYFLTNKVTGRYQTRIDLILDLLAKKTDDNREKYYTFFEIDKMRKEHSLDAIWRKIQQTFLVLKDWFENHTLYHKIGYLIASDAMQLQEIYDLSVGQTKKGFLASLDECIRKSIAISGNYADREYTNTVGFKKISTLLLLFNVESVRRNGEQSQWFPFDKFKFNQGNKVQWSIEHIHAQHSEGMRTQEVWKQWLQLHIPSVKAVSSQHDTLIEKMKAAVEKTKLEREEFDALQAEVVQILSAEGSLEYMHSIANLALLNSSDNAALNNSTFDVKRNRIVEMDKQGQYIPFCTKMVFLKYYTPSEKNQLHFWGQADRIAYVQAINEVLKDYLEEPITVEEEE